MVDWAHSLMRIPALKENRRLLYRMAEISVISQKFLFSHIQNQNPKIFFIHHFLIYDPHHGDLLWGLPPPNVTHIIRSPFVLTCYVGWKP